MDMYSRVCAVCRQKNSSRELNQLRAIEQFLKQKNVTERKQIKDGDPAEKMQFIQAMTMYSHENCQYGLYCSILSDRRVKFNRIAEDIAKDVLQYIKTADQTGIQEFLRYFQGYFPAGYKWIERYWYSMEKKRKEGK